MSAKLAKLEAVLADLEKAAGMAPNFEVVEVGAEPLTDAPIIIERVRFRRTDPQSVGLLSKPNGFGGEDAQGMQCS